MNAPILPIMLTDKQEQFCQQILAGKSQMEAYCIAYKASPKAGRANGSRLIARDDVQARIMQLRANNSAAQRVSLQSLTADLQRTGLSAEVSGQHGAAVAAWMGLAKLHGFLIDKQQVDMVLRRPSANPDSPDEMSELEWVSKHGMVIDHNPLEPDAKVSQSEPQGSEIPITIPNDLNRSGD